MEGELKQESTPETTKQETAEEGQNELRREVGSELEQETGHEEAHTQEQSREEGQEQEQEKEQVQEQENSQEQEREQEHEQEHEQEREQEHEQEQPVEEGQHTEGETHSADSSTEPAATPTTATTTTSSEETPSTSTSPPPAPENPTPEASVTQEKGLLDEHAAPPTPPPTPPSLTSYSQPESREETKPARLPTVDTQKAAHRQQVLADIIRFKQTFVQSLLHLSKVYTEPLHTEKNPLGLTDDDLSKVFGNIDDIIHTNMGLLDRLHNPTGAPFADVVSEINMYSAYVANYEPGIERLGRLLKSGKLSQFLSDCQKQAPGTLMLEDYLIMPIQHLPHYVLLLRELLKFTNEEHPDYQNLSSAVEKLSQMVRQITKAKQIHNSPFQSLQKRIGFSFNWNTVGVCMLMLLLICMLLYLPYQIHQSQYPARSAFTGNASAPTPFSVKSPAIKTPVKPVPSQSAAKPTQQPAKPTHQPVKQPAKPTQHPKQPGKPTHQPKQPAKPSQQPVKPAQQPNKHQKPKATHPPAKHNAKQPTTHPVKPTTHHVKHTHAHGSKPNVQAKSAKTA